MFIHHFQTENVKPFLPLDIETGFLLKVIKGTLTLTTPNIKASGKDVEQHTHTHTHTHTRVKK